jgi:hypothetical protein
MESVTEIANFALTQLGAVSEIQNLGTDTSKEARVLRRVFYSTLKTILSGKNWFFATTFQKLALQSIYPTPEWPFAYLRPAQCLRMTRIWNQGHTDTLENEIKYLSVNNGTQRVIVSEYGPTSILAGTPWNPTQPTLPLSGTTWPIPVAQCVTYTENCSLMPEKFKMGIGFLVAALAAPSLPGIGQVDLREKNLGIGNVLVAEALADDQNESRQFVDLRSIIQKAGQGELIRGEETYSYRAYNAGNFQA